ncbi:hypothetical protein, partial [Klebsiella pneumoniae]|uniref:hypothetical protein n=1 Tax=Klebsiella pneumoniae TaxID=573 RepID=UPI003EE11BBC
SGIHEPSSAGREAVPFAFLIARLYYQVETRQTSKTGIIIRPRSFHPSKASITPAPDVAIAEKTKRLGYARRWRSRQRISTGW